VDFQDQKAAPAPKAERNPNNYNILKGGQVDPGSKLYQRSVAGREQLKDYLSRLWNDGTDEADVFMAGVKSLMNRGHGYVGAYLDSKNPGRRYEQNQAMAITDQVMTDEGIGEHPGNRLTRPKVEDEEGNIDKEATKEARAKRREANKGRGFGPQQAPGKKAMPVGQQRKQGKRTGSERVDEGDKRREGIDDPTKYEQPVKADTGDAEFYNRDQIKKALEDRMSGKATTDDVLAAYQTTYQKPLSDSPQADAERRQKRAESRDRFYTTGSGKMPDGEKKPTGGGAKAPAGGGGQPPAAPDQPPTAQPPDPGSAKSPGEAKAPAATPQPEQEQPEEKAKWRAPGEGREDTGVVEEVKTGVSGTGGGMLSAQSRPVIGPWARNENEYKQSITSVFDRLIKDEVESQYKGLGGVRDPRKKIGIESKIYSDPRELEYVIKDTIRDFVSKDKDLQGTDFDDFARNHLDKLIAYRTGQDVEEEPSAPAPAAPAPVSAAKETIRNAATESLPDFRNAVMRQLKLPLGSRDAKTRIADGAAGRREQKLETQRTRTGQEMAKAARARQRTAPKTTQPELFTPSGKPKQFKTEPASNPIANAVAEVGKILRSPDVKQTSLDSFARMVLNGIERHKRATGGKGFGR
jgi:hypothetical protein